jgi:tricorn protease
MIGEMLAELGTSHTYIWGGDDRNQGEPIDVGLLGADLVLENGNIRIRNRLSAPDWSGLADGPVAPAWVGVPDNSVLRSIDGRSLVSGENPYALLQGKAGAVVTLGISSEPGGEITTVRVRPIPEERPLRYANWVESNRRFVAERTEDRVGYLHLPDMDGEGLSMFGKLFYPQVKKDAMIVDVRDNGGGFVSQMIIARLARRPWAYDKPRHGNLETYPSMVLDGPMVVLINEHAGSDGDIFPESFKMLDLGPLIGTRTWGGVIGIRADKPSVDGGITTQPEYAWWEPNRGWSLENSGVSPDIEVEITPANRQDGRDRQLERGLKEIVEALQKNPPKKPTPPPYPKK